MQAAADSKGTVPRVISVRSHISRKARTSHPHGHSSRETSDSRFAPRMLMAARQGRKKSPYYVFGKIRYLEGLGQVLRIRRDLELG